jgi:transglutaminase-like putative cysteine protease
MTKHESIREHRPAIRGHSGFVLRHSFVIRHSSFVIASLLVLAISSPTVIAQEPAGVIVSERWETAYLNDLRSGYVHTRVVEHKIGGDVGYISSIEMKLQVKRLGSVVSIGMEVGDSENAVGFVTGTFMRQFNGREQILLIEGKVDGNKLLFTKNKTEQLAPARWSDRVVGIYGQQKLLKEAASQSAMKDIPFLSFESSINLIVKTHLKIGEPEEIKLFGAKRKLLRAEIRAEEIQKFQPPPLIVWLDGDREVVVSETEIPGFGRLNLYRTTKDIATAAPGAKLSEVDSKPVPLRERVPQFNQTTSALYRIRIKGDEHAANSFSHDERQKVIAGEGDTLELEVKKGPVAHAEKAEPEYLESSHFITSADPKVRQRARAAVAGVTDPWEKARRIESYVHRNMKVTADQQLATAQQVAAQMEGDCTEYAMLTAAMCRAEGVPARTAVGLVYGDTPKGAIFAFHMWTEVWVKGEWRAIDATLGQGGIGAMHLKISDQSWKDEVTAAPLLPTLRVLGRVSIDVVRHDYKPRP